MITADDIGKKVFLRLQPDGQDVAKWENEGAVLKGIVEGGAKVLVKMPDGSNWKLNPEVVRVFNPRPK